MLTAEQQPSCWDVTGWMNPNSWTTQAVLVAASCETVPNTIGWTQVFLGYGGAPSAPLWLRVPLNDWHVTQGWFFQPLLVYGGESGGVPVVKTDILVGPNGDPQGHWLLPYPPAQGVPAGGARARLRHVATNKCLYSDNQNGAPVHNWRCWNDPRMVYVLDNAGSGTYRLRHEMTGQCLYGQPYNGGALSNWICWADSVMRFSLDYDSGSGAYFLRNVDRNQCPYGNAKDGGVVPTWGCWPDPQMLFRVDLL